MSATEDQTFTYTGGRINWGPLHSNSYTDRITHLIVDAGVCEIEDEAFRLTASTGFPNLRSVRFLLTSQSRRNKEGSFAGTRLIRIGHRAFQRCSSLKEIHLPDTVHTIGEDAFEDCQSLLRITFPASLRSIGYGAFKDCESLITPFIAAKI